MSVDDEASGPSDATLKAALEILHAASEPSSDDPARWTPPEVVAMVLQYAYGVEALLHVRDPRWGDAQGLAEEVLFLRDMIADWLALHDEDEEALEELLTEELEDLPLPSETDERLMELYRDDAHVREYIHDEYRRFREDVEPPRHALWWWLDAELFGKQIH